MNESVATSLLAARPGAAALPSVDRLLGLAFIPALLDEFGRAAVSGAIRTLLDDKRHAIVDGATPEGVWPPGVQWLEGELRARLESQSVPRLRRVFNLTGTVLHTNLGRAPLAGAALDRFGARVVVQFGLLLTIVGLALFGLLPLNTATFYTSGALVGFGLSGLLGAPLRYITLEAAGADRRGAGQGLLTLFLSVGQLVGAALIGGVVASTATELGGYRQALLAVAAGCVVALMLSAALRGRVSAQDA